MTAAEDPGKLSRTIQNWLENLPATNTEESAEFLLTTLTQIRELNQQPHELMTIVRQIRPVIDDLCVSLLQLAQRHGFSKKSLREKQLKLNNQLQETLLFCYGDCVDGFLENNDKRNNTALTEALFCQMGQLNHMLSHRYQHYLLPINAQWKIAHHAYRLADSHHLLDNPVSPYYQSLFHYPCIRHQYNHCLLMSMANLAQLRGDDIRKCERLIQKISEFLRLDDKITPAALHIVQLNQDKPPTYQSLLQGKAIQSHWRAVECSEIKNTIHKKLLPQSRNENKNIWLAHEESKTDIPNYVLQHFLSAITSFPSRREVREKSSGQITLCIGLASTHHFLSGEVPFTQPLRYLPPEDHLSTPALDNTQTMQQLREAQEQAASGKIIYDPQVGQDLKMQQEKAAQNTNYLTQNWQLENLSDTGFCFSTKELPATQIQSGEVIGIHYPDGGEDNQGSWRIAIIRWVKYEGNEQLKIGVSLVNGQPHALSIRKKQTQSQAHFQRGLFIKEHVPTDSQFDGTVINSLITPILSYEMGDILEVREQDQHREILLSTQFDWGGRYHHFRFDDMKSPAAIAALKKQERK